MKKNNMFKRILCVLTASICCLMGTTMSSVAAEETTPPETEEIVEASSSTPTATGMKTITTYATINIKLTNSRWSASFYAGVMGNQGAQYEVLMTTPTGNQYRRLFVGGSQNLTDIVTLLYAPAGTYKFEFTRISGSANQASAIVEIY